MDKSSTKDDASPLSTSTESETFDTWTLISDKPKDLASDEIAFTQLAPEKSDYDAENADDAIHVDAVKEPELLHDNRYNDMDDLSDGISIISECESVGRLSPHPELRKRLSDINMLYTSLPEPPAAADRDRKDCCETLNYDACSGRSSDIFHRVEPLLETNRKSSTHQLVESKVMSPTKPHGLRGLFYVGALLAIIAFISKVKYDAWESVLGSKTALLTQKISELELNNNLMRAEIDILSKQVKYLTTLSENQKPANKPKNNQPRDNAFKAWPGNGNKIEEVIITPEDLKKPFKCDGHNNVDLAGMCIELDISKEIPKETNEVNEKDFSITIDDLIQAIPTPAGNPFTGPVTNPPSPSDQQWKDDYIPHEHKASDQDENKKYEKRDNQKKYSKNHNGESKENDKPRRGDRSSEERDNSAERYKKSKDYKKNEKRMSSSEYEKAKREADGYWHEKMMQHRENSRKNNEKYRQEKNDKNWYIERGDSREQARYDQKQHRGHGQR